MDFSKFTNQFQLSKTLRFKLIPQGKTEENFMFNKILEDDKIRAEEYKIAKEYIDNYHKNYIERKLSNFNFDESLLLQYADFYYGGDKNHLEAMQKNMMKEISGFLQKDEEYKSLFGNKLFTDLLPKFLSSKEEIKIVEDFANFTTYFTNFYENRKNMYSGDGKSTEIAYRVVKQNFPKFLDNIRAWEKIQNSIPAEKISKLDDELNFIVEMNAADIFKPESFNYFIAQSGIDKFNSFIGGYSNEVGNKKVQGLNEIINLFNQENKTKVPKLKPLFKQILSDREKVSFLPECFNNDMEVVQAVADFGKIIESEIPTLNSVLFNISEYDTEHIYVPNNVSITTLSKIMFGDWRIFDDGLALRYDKEHTYPSDSKKAEKYEKDKEKSLKAVKSYSLGFLVETSKLNDFSLDVLVNKISSKSRELCTSVFEAYEAAKKLLDTNYPDDRKLVKDNESIEKIKNLLDAVKEYQHFTELFLGYGEEPDKDAAFYGAIDEAYNNISEINSLYDKVRNYITKKPYSKEKYKLNFNRSDFLGGWGQPNEWGKSEAHLLEKSGKYYVFVTSRTLREAEWRTIYNKDNYEFAEIFEYIFQKPDFKNTARLFIRSKGDSYAPSVGKYELPIENVIDVYDKGYFKTEYKDKNNELFKKSLTAVIDYFKVGFSRHESYKCFDMKWNPSEEYDNINDFCNDTINSCYKIQREPINFNGILEMVDSGMGYLFEIYCKDFSQSSHGLPNLHTMYFKALFDKQNLQNTKIKLCGGAEMFYRVPSLKLNETTIHKANEPINNKNPLNKKKQSTFEYDLIKDKRFTANHYELHLPITLNFQSGNSVLMNNVVREEIRNTDNQYVIGIDRGERNLIYATVIDENGNIKEQSSFNIIKNEYNGNEYETDYQALLVSKAADREKARKDWKTIDAIKDLKEGYLSQAVHKICELVVKYNAVIVMENLNSGFKNTRSAVESSVYQKFEKMLTDKLAYLADKKKELEEIGSILNAYQLALPKTSYNDMQGQNGIIFYIPAWNTSKIDPTTGFVDMLKPKREEDSRAFLSKFKSIRYNKTDNMFEFEVNMNDFPKTEAFYKKDWIICSYGERIWTHQNGKNGEWVSERLNPTDGIASLLQSKNIDFENGEELKTIIVSQGDKQFCSRLTWYFALILQMRNSITKSTAPEDDYLISPVRNDTGDFYDSRKAGETLPKDADANGAYNIARKGLLAIKNIRDSEDDKTSPTSITNAQWLEYAQTHFAK